VSTKSKVILQFQVSTTKGKHLVCLSIDLITAFREAKTMRILVASCVVLQKESIGLIQAGHRKPCFFITH